jgi:aminoglycoside/choline kinase family phosphotransferase/GTP:adenosylcobinamide-phosphate guanylyltransferase
MAGIFPDSSSGERATMNWRRNVQCESFLNDNGWASSQREPMPSDASARRYIRLCKRTGISAILMDAPPFQNPATPAFVDIAERLKKANLRAPNILANDITNGFVLLEDFGDRIFRREIDGDASNEIPLYAAAVDVLAALAKQPLAAEGLASYDLDRHFAEAQLYAQWWLPDDVDVVEFRERIRTSLAEAARARQVLVMRDFHAENLVWLPGDRGVGRVGLLDFQDALAGHPAYDLMSLLQDARRDVSEQLVVTMIARFIQSVGIVDTATFKGDLAALAAVRNLKIIGIFSRLWLRDGKPRYLAFIPRVWANLQRDLQHPRCRDLRRWVEEVSPPVAERLTQIKGTKPRARPAAAARPIDTAMILAAGLGTRMGDRTRETPKPLLSVAGEPLIDHAFRRAREIGANRFVVNTHYRAERIAKHCQERVDLDIAVSSESPVRLETGGGVRKALPLINRDVFAVLNSDAIWTSAAPLNALVAFWDPNTMDALLALTPSHAALAHKGVGDFFLDQHGRLRRRRHESEAPFIFSGAQIITRRAFEGAPSGAFSLNHVWDNLIAQQRAFGVVASGGWIDIGSPQGLAAAEEALSP